MLEQGIQSKIIKALSRSGCYVVKIMAASKAGTPDLIACYRGRFIAIECKQPGKSPTELQASKLEAVKNAQGFAVTLSSVSGVTELLKAVDSAILDG